MLFDPQPVEKKHVGNHPVLLVDVGVAKDFHTHGGSRGRHGRGENDVPLCLQYIAISY